MGLLPNEAVLSGVGTTLSASHVSRAYQDVPVLLRNPVSPIGVVLPSSYAPGKESISAGNAPLRAGTNISPAIQALPAPLAMVVLT